MPVLSDPKLEAFSQELLKNLARGMQKGKAAEDAARKAQYTGSSLGPNARKRAQRRDVKARMIELAAPAFEARKEEVEATVDWAIDRLVNIASPDLGEDAIKVADQLNALRLMAQMRGWMAPEKRDVTVRTDEMTDDELARIAAGGRPGAPAAPVDP